MARPGVRTIPLGRVAVASTAMLVTTLTACGAPDFTYVKNSTAKTYFKVPAEWHKIEQRELDNAMTSDDPDSAAAQARPKTMWSIGYDAHDDPDAFHFYGLNTDQPFVFALIRPLTREERGSISLDRLRDAFLPVTEGARQTLAQQNGGLSDFELLRDEELEPKGDGLRGVRTTFNYRFPTLLTLQTFDVSSYASDQGRLYVMVIRCSARCFLDRKGELDSIARSFTVRT
ncbi:hypothetical protein [Spirillospora sp. NPDC047279]|uniref:hypothetical protein n=1 Tax=Spirillospora sp. NPDC047279 TaxID=3155478 RepID=UPI00340CCCF3